MPAAYDTYNYPSYWENRKYEHESEVFAIKSLLEKVPKIDSIADIGAGFGRLVPSYSFRTKRIILVDPSQKLLKMAKEMYPNLNIKYIHSRGENVGKKIKTSSVDMAICVRVLHHARCEKTFLEEVTKIIKDGGYLLLEYPNKSHFLARFREFLKGNFTFPIDITPKDIRSPKSLKKKTLPFYNYHPEKIESLLKENGLSVIEKRSVSNIRIPWLKKIVGTNFLLDTEKKLQKPLSKINFGPSIFILAKKVG